MLSGQGPAAYADRADRPDLTLDGHPKIVPLRVAPSFYLEPRDPDPRGMLVIGLDDEVAGTVVDVWVDRSEPQIRYLQVEVSGARTNVLLPITVAKISASRREVRVRAITAAQFADVPTTAVSDIVTLREEDRIQAYYSAGYLYATPDRLGPLL
jgi:photosynthetic reaction center H subunit